MIALTLDTLLPYVLPHLSPALASEDTIPTLYEMAGLLPPVGRGGFECRLAPGDAQVDLHQLIKRSYGEHHVLASYLSQPEVEVRRTGAAWAALRRFASWWSGEDAEAAALISSIFLELDGNATPAPSVFFKLGGSEGVAAAQAQRLVDEVFDAMALPPPPARVRDVITAVGDEPARLTHVGVMLSRSTSALRLNVAACSIEAIPGLLRALGWPGDHDALEREIEGVAPHVEKIVCALDVGETVYPHVGLECFPDEQGGPGNRWRGFLDALTHRGLCNPEKAEGFLAFQRLLLPSTASKPWPDPLVRYALTTERKGFSTIACMVHHVKLTLAPGRPVNAKGYLGFGHQWVDSAHMEITEPAVGHTLVLNH